MCIRAYWLAKANRAFLSNVDLAYALQMNAINLYIDAAAAAAAATAHKHIPHEQMHKARGDYSTQPSRTHQHAHKKQPAIVITSGWWHGVGIR